jgi:hypothetical protein
MMKQHKWHKEIKAWADGAEIEHKWEDAWYVSSTPKWSDDVEYRIKPSVKEPRYLWVYINTMGQTIFLHGKSTNSDWKFWGRIKLEDL